MGQRLGTSHLDRDWGRDWGQAICIDGERLGTRLGTSHLYRRKDRIGIEFPLGERAEASKLSCLTLESRRAAQPVYEECGYKK